MAPCVDGRTGQQIDSDPKTAGFQKIGHLIGSGAADQRIVALIAHQNVIAAQTQNAVIAAPPEQQVVGGIGTLQRVIEIRSIDPFDADQRIGVAPCVGGGSRLEVHIHPQRAGLAVIQNLVRAVPAIQRVIARLAHQHIISRAAGQAVVAAMARQFISAPQPVQGIVLCRPEKSVVTGVPLKIAITAPAF